MLRALTELDEYKALFCHLDDSDEIAEEQIVMLYLAIRLKPLLGKHYITEEDINDYAEELSNQYFTNRISLDLMINAIYNYINCNRVSPDLCDLQQDIIEFLETYNEEQFSDKKMQS